MRPFLRVSFYTCANINNSPAACPYPCAASWFSLNDSGRLSVAFCKTSVFAVEPKPKRLFAFNFLSLPHLSQPFRSGNLLLRLQILLDAELLADDAVDIRVGRRAGLAV